MSSEIPSGGWAIRAQGLGKTYRLYDKPHHRLLQSLWRGRKNYFREFAALSDVSFLYSDRWIEVAIEATSSPKPRSAGAS